VTANELSSEGMCDGALMALLKHEIASDVLVINITFNWNGNEIFRSLC
jgi:hypothetical protein